MCLRLRYWQVKGSLSNEAACLNRPKFSFKHGCMCVCISVVMCAWLHMRVCVLNLLINLSVLAQMRIVLIAISAEAHLTLTCLSVQNSKCYYSNSDMVELWLCVQTEIAQSEKSVSSATLEQKLSGNTNAITALCDQLKGVEIQVQKTKRQVKELSEQVSKLQQRSDDAERCSRRWNLWLYGMKEATGENIQVDIMKLFVTLTPEEKEKICFLVNTVHRVGVPPCPIIIIQFTMRNFRNKIWKISCKNEILKEKKLMLKEDFTHADRMERNRLWPLVEAARKQGKRAGLASMGRCNVFFSQIIQLELQYY